MTQKKIYQRHINSGAVTSIAELLCFVADKSLTLTRQGASYVGVKDANGRRFRLFLPDHPKAMRAGLVAARGPIYDFWIYALFACCAGKVARYVGQTRRVSRRI
ncbi:hypothetical protein ACSFA0_19770 [Variovorax sp. LT1P1]|uniref:hypothetical protein n=1 Tax=Variovorax sp. LT1P1 TaxID=3443730 RepID=UPI003F461C44